MLHNTTLHVAKPPDNVIIVVKGLASCVFVFEILCLLTGIVSQRFGWVHARINYKSAEVSIFLYSRKVLSFLHFMYSNKELKQSFWPLIIQSYLSYRPPVLTYCRLNELTHTVYWKNPISSLSRPGLDFLGEKLLNYLQIVKTLIKCSILQHLIWVYTVCLLPFFTHLPFRVSGWEKSLVLTSFPLALVLEDEKFV